MIMNNKEIVKLINNSLKELSFSNDKIGEAMKYTLVDDGAKRLRPLCFCSLTRCLMNLFLNL